MRINTNSVYYSRQLSQNRMLPITFCSNNNSKPLVVYLDETLGFPTKENTEKTIAYTNSFFNEFGTNIETLHSLYQKNVDKIISFFSKFNVSLEKNNGIYSVDKTPELDIFSKQELNDIILRKKALDMLYLKNADKFLKSLTYNDIIPSVEYKNINEDFLAGMYDSVIKKAQYVTGSASPDSMNNIKINAESLKNYPSFLLLREKEKLVDDLNVFFSSKKWLESGAFTDYEKTIISKKIEQYKSLKIALGRDNVISDNVENVYAKRKINISDAPLGTYVDGEGVIIQKCKIYDKISQSHIPCTMFLKKRRAVFELFLKKDTEYSKIENFVDKYNELKFELNQNNNVDEIKKQLDTMATDLIDERKNSTVAKIGFKFDMLERLPLYFSKCNEDALKEFMQEYSINKTKNSPFTYVADFANTDSKRYVNAGMRVGLVLLKLLKKMEAPDIFIQAYNHDKRSPVMMYLKAGFKLIYPSQKDFEIALVNKSEVVNRPIFLYKSLNTCP